MKILFNSPVWYIILCVIVAGLGAYFLYRNDTKLKELPITWKRVLGGFRFVSLFIITFLLLEPLLEFSKNKVEKPIVVIVQDNSSSILANQDSVAFREDYTQKLTQITQGLGANYEVVSYSFGKELKEESKLDYKESATNISQVFSEIQQRYYNRNLGAIVLASDGIYNQGSNPIYEAQKLKNIPVYSIALGDTTPKKDVWIEDVFHNNLAYEGNTFPVEVSINSNQIRNQLLEISLVKSGVVLQKKQTTVTSGEGIAKVRFEVEATQNGLQKYEVRIAKVEGEYTVENNNRAFYVEVLKSKQKILIVANSPHPDLQALKNGLITNENYELEVKLASDLPKTLESYSLIITHNLPSKSHPVAKVFGSDIPTFSFVGNQTDMAALNKLDLGIGITTTGTFTEAGSYGNVNFSEFQLSSETQNSLVGFRPIQVPFSNSYKLSNSLVSAVYQRIGPAKTTYPLLAFGMSGDKKIGVFVGEGIWNWRLQEYAEKETTKGFDDLFQQSVQLLVAKEDKSRFRTKGKPTYEGGEAIRFSAEVYNKSYELVNSQEVAMTIKNENGKEFTYLFSPQGNAYSLDAGKLAPGKFSYLATTVLDGKAVTKSGEFSISSIGLEQKNTQANHEILYQLSQETKGKTVRLDESASLIELITDNENMVSVSYQESEVDDFIEMKYLFFLLLLLLGVEWFVRKRNGGY